MANHFIQPITVQGTGPLCIKHGGSEFTRAAPWRTAGVLDGGMSLSGGEDADAWTSGADSVSSLSFGVSCVEDITIRINAVSVQATFDVDYEVYLDSDLEASGSLTNATSADVDLTSTHAPCGKVIDVLLFTDAIHSTQVDVTITAVS